MIDPVYFAKWMHVLGSTILFGTGIGTAFYFVMAKRTGEPRIIAAVGRMVVVGDWLFTGTSGLLQPLTGLHLAVHNGYELTEPWLLATFVLYALALACWLPVVWLQIRMTRLAEASASAGTPLPARFHRLFRYWFWLGWPAFLALAAIFYLMITRPS